MSQTQIAKLSPRHEAILNWLIENPERLRRECAAQFGVSEAWLSIVINSDCFQAKLAERQEAVFSVVAADIPTKLRGIADMAMARVAETIPNAGPDFALETMNSTLKALGFGAKPHLVAPAGSTFNTQNNYYVAKPEELSEARDLMNSVGRTLEGEASVLPPLAAPASA